MPELTLSPQVFAILNALIEERIGLSYSLADRALLESKLIARVEEAGFDSALDYYYHLRYEPDSAAEFALLAESLLVHETYFFRELEQLVVLVDEFIAPRVTGRRPRIWSAACSTGEEPLTIAMLLAERGLLERVDLVASDVSRAAVARARAGEVGRRALRQVPLPGLAERWLETRGTTVRARPELGRAIDWRCVNLLDDQAIAALGDFDAIVCRNVLIYFRDEVVARVVASLTERLGPDGVLAVGVSESLMRFGTALRCEEHGGAFVYRKASP